MDYEYFFSDLQIKKHQRIYPEIFKHLKPVILKELLAVLIKRRKVQTGRPIHTNLSKIIDGIFLLANTGCQSSNIPDIYEVPKSTFYLCVLHELRYLKIVKEHQIFQKIYNQVIQNYPRPDLLITDTFTVKSMDGSEGLGKKPTDRKRAGLKVSIVCDTRRVAIATHIIPANDHDTTALRQTIPKIKPFKPSIKCLADSGYVGKELAKECLQYGLKMIVQPQKTRAKDGRMTHTLSAEDHTLLKKNRNQIELLNGQIRRFRGLMLKWSKSLSTYECTSYYSTLYNL